ncbi:hypothetical protein HF086_003201, partial [Spodoptera exigua]
MLFFQQSGTFECFICKTRLKTSRALRKHLTSQHTEQYSCNACSFVTRNRNPPRNDSQSNHGHSIRRNERRPIIHPRTPRPDDDLESQSPVTCEQSMALLKDHMWVHTGVKRFKCDRCTKSFTQKTNLIIHMKVHSGNRPSYECPLCGKHFAFYNNRRRHMF